MAVNVRIIRNSVTGGVAVAAAILAAGCSSSSSTSSAAPTATASAPSSSASAASTPTGGASSAASGGATGTASSPTGGGTATAGAAACSSANLRISLSSGGAGAGTDFTIVDFTNGGVAPCTVYGYPGVSLANSSGAQIGAAATRNPSKPSALVTLAPGAKANATLGVANAENYPAADCKPTSSSQLRVFPPNQTKAIEVPFSTTGCAVSSAHQLSVTAVAAGAGVQQ